ncbi:FAD-dependent oxidoreductase [Altererythrobacter xixiisoli]|uniref:FAD-dependent oxidoreductase n=1 Tax=Croceibacterium xixiisoli TaxID=1476466 RepID=A0A6I4TSB1_9SPHN|nr:FAD/NAD(P)-binding protein [Croceibacterium xixiisoli]MXO98764.1 FAD-dependent oxidoreductase [Croceibacterium xixiisoli]
MTASGKFGSLDSTGNQGELPVAIIGAGFSGTLLAINLLRHGVKVVLIERDGANLAKGLAFGTRQPEHLLNVRAVNMSALPDDASHFLRWMGFSGSDLENRFVPRLAYGHYLRELLIETLAAAPGRADVLTAEVVAAHFDEDRARLTLSDGDEVPCRAVVLALGNFPPDPHPVLAGLSEPTWFADPWTPGVLDDLDTLDHILLVGTGLTAIDIAVSLDRAGFQGRITALSRRGLRPRSHAETGPTVAPVSRPQADGTVLLRQIRQRAAQIGWRGAIDELRPHTQHIWRRHDAAAQASFLRHCRPFWDVHRHRLAPQVADRVAAMEKQGRLRVLAGNLLSAEPAGHVVRIGWRPRGSDDISRMAVDRIIGCTGPSGDLARSPDALLQGLLATGAIRPDVHRLGLDVDHVGRVKRADGTGHDRLFAVGPITKGEAWEMIAVPDIRRQVWSLARQLANAHWVGGEGL